MAKTPHKSTTAASPPASTPTASAGHSPEDAYRPTALDIFELSAQLGPATQDEVDLLIARHSFAELVDIGNDFATARATRDALRILGVAAAFLQHAPASDQGLVDLSLDVVRIGAWAAAEDARANEKLTGATASERTSAASAEAEAQRVLTQARAERRKLADTVRAVAQSTSVDVAVTHALAPAAHGAARTSPDASLELLLQQARALLASKDPAVKRRAALYRLTPARLDGAAALAKAASQAATVVGAPKVVVTQEKVDWWDGATLTILQTVVRAFQGARETHPGVPRVEFVSLRKRAGASDAGGDPIGGGGEPKGGVVT
ncbi:MAG: hypothetical protein IPF99_27260 [Deltaproteobacteria bacterium]|jgi:hypothetical protein|nr:hypothetical protein [Deltaproteobacteria bacterium]